VPVPEARRRDFLDDVAQAIEWLSTAMWAGGKPDTEPHANEPPPSGEANEAPSKRAAEHARAPTNASALRRARDAKVELRLLCRATHESNCI